MIITFQELSSLIMRCCKVSNQDTDPTDFASKHAFTVDINKMETIFRDRKLDYHIIACTTELASYIPYMTDVHHLAQYVKDSDELNDILNGLNQIAVFSIYCDHNKDGEIQFRINKDAEDELNDKDLFDLCNKDGKINLDLIAQLMKGTPNYSILVYRRFSPARDRFAYTVKYIANKEMNQYYKSVEEEITKKK